MGKRHTSRKVAMQVLYQVDVAGGEWSAILHQHIEDERINPETAGFAAELLDLVAAHQVEIDRELRERLKDWDIDRLSLVDKSILRLAMAELLFASGAAPAVVIHEALELANHFGSEGSSRFVNGVLGAVLRGRYNAAQSS